MYKIMLVDDEEQNLFLMERIIDWEEVGFRVCGIALDGIEGIQVFEETNPDVVFVDIQMEQMDGLTLIGELRKKGKDAIFVIVTAYDEFAYAQKAISLGVDSYLLKPLARSEMISMMKEIKQKLDDAKEQEERKSFISARYENGVFQKAVRNLEDICLNNIPSDPSMDARVWTELERIIDGQCLRTLELFSPNDSVENMINLTKDWQIKYKFPQYDDLYCIVEEKRVPFVLEEFRKLEEHNMRRKYILQVNQCFTHAEEFRKMFVSDFSLRNSWFYKEESGSYKTGDFRVPDGKEYFEDEEEKERCLQKLLYNASAQEMIDLIGKMLDYASEKKSAPAELIDEMINLLILIKSQLTKLYEDRAFMILRHQNVWELHKIRTKGRLFTEMTGLLLETETAIREMLQNKRSYSLMRKAKEYTMEHFVNPEFSASEVAEFVYLSRNHFLKIFKEEMGITFWDYVTQVRMEKAKQLLKQTNDTVYTISNKVGYESQYHFSRKFKKLFGVSPNDFRNL